MSESSLPIRSSPSQATPIPDDDHEADLPLTMTASVVLTSLPRDATAALKDAGAFDKPKGTFSPPPNTDYPAFSQAAVTVRFKAIGSAPILKQPVCRINATQRFEAVVAYLRRVVKCGPQDSVFLYVNNTFAPSLDEIVGNLHRVSPFIASELGATSSKRTRDCVGLMDTSAFEIKRMTSLLFLTR